MKTIRFVKTAALVSIIFLSSCKKETGNADDNNTNNNPTIQAITLLKSNNWKVAASSTREKYEGVLGGGFQTLAFD